MEKIQCPHCPAKIDSRRFDYHVEMCVASKPYPCQLCGKRFPTPKGVSGHISKFHTADERGTEFKCRYCEHGSNSKKDMEKHESIHEEEGGHGFRSRSRSRSRGPVSFSESSIDSPVSLKTTPITHQSRATANPVNVMPSATSVTHQSRATAKPVNFVPYVRNVTSLLSPDVFATQSDETMPQYPISRSKSVQASNNRAKSKQPVVNTQSTYQIRAKSRPVNNNIGVSNLQGTSQRSWAQEQPNKATLSKYNNNNLQNEEQNEMNCINSSTQVINTLSLNQNGIIQSTQFNFFDKEAARKKMAEENAMCANTIKLMRKQNKQLRKQCKLHNIPLTEDAVEKLIKEFEDHYGPLTESEDSNDEEEN